MLSDSSIKVSVSMITYNHEKFIAKALDSVLMQKTDFDFEIVIGEDCSTDQTREIVIDYQKRNPDRMRLILSEKNLGAGKNAEQVSRACKGKYVALLEGDDYWTSPDKLQKQIDFMEANPDCKITFHAAEIVNSDGEKTGELLRPYLSDSTLKVEDILFRSGGDVFATGSAIFLKSVLDNVPQWFFEGTVGDIPLTLICTYHGRLGYMDEVMSARRRGVVGSWRESFFKDKAKRIDFFNGMASMYKSFNNYTEGKYSFLIESAINHIKRNLILSIDDKKMFNESKYKNMLMHFNLLEKGKVYLKIYCPNIYEILTSMLKWIINLRAVKV